MNNLKVTGIITSYNNGKFFKEAYQGMLNQTFPISELIIVDDLSTDNTRDLIEDTINNIQTDIPVQFIKHEKNGGPSAARNSAIKASTGDIVAFCDGDDFYYKNKVLKSVEILYNHGEVGCVYTDYDMLYQGENKVVREFKHPYHRQLLNKTCIVSTNSIVKRKVFDIVGLFDERFFGTEDYHMWLKISQRMLLMHVPEALFAYRVHGNNITSDENKLAMFNRDIQTFKKELKIG